MKRSNRKPQAVTEPNVFEPPVPALFVCHAMIVAEAADVLREHFCAMCSLLGEHEHDAVLEKNIHGHFYNLKGEMRSFVDSVTNLTYVPGLDDREYRRRVRELMPTVEYIPIAGVAQFVESFRRYQAKLNVTGLSSRAD